MGTLQRILKNFAALAAGRMISVLQQIVLPAVFVYRYGLAGYGEWMALSGAVAALGMLNFGLQSFMNQDLAIRFNAPEASVDRREYHVRQSTALRLLAGVIVVTAVLLLGFFLVPFDTLLRLDLTRRAAQVTLYLLALQVLGMILLGYFGGIFLSVNRAHRGSNWNNAQALMAALGLLVGVLLHVSFPVLAGIQLATLGVAVVGVLADLKLSAPEVFPSLRYWDGAAIREILHGSGYFGMIEMSTFLVYQAPLLIMQRVLGPSVVGAFTLMRTIFSMCRQILSAFTQSMSAEITVLYGRKDWPNLSRLYSYSERFIFFLIALVNLTVLMLSPVLITLWIHKKQPGGLLHGLLHAPVSGLFALYPYVLCSALSIVISLKEHKAQFQFSTNTHVEMARVMFFSYVAMVFVAVGTIHAAGVIGFLWTWMAVESLQTVWLVGLNSKLFRHVETVDRVYIVRLGVLCAAGLVGAIVALPHTAAMGLPAQAGIGVSVAAVVGGLAWQVFGVGVVVAGMRRRMAKGFA
jgi:O-antigen/teichoic acid export membrane protein